MRKKGKCLLLGVFAAGLVLLLCELLTRAFLSPDSELLQGAMQLRVCGELLAAPDPDLFWRTGGSVPDLEISARERSQLKVACLTDSVGVMYEGKGYPDILQGFLEELFPSMRPWVFNAGVPGYTSYQGLKHFQRDLLGRQFDVVVVCYGWNDHWQSNNGVPDRLQNSQHRRIAKAVLGRSRCLSLATALLTRYRARHYSCVGPRDSVRVALEDYARNLSSFVDICERHDIGLILMTAPFLADEDLDWIPLHQQYNEVVCQISQAKSVPLVDLVNEFKDRRDLFIDAETDKVHYNWTGASIVARSIADCIARCIVTVGKGERAPEESAIHRPSHPSSAMAGQASPP